MSNVYINKALRKDIPSDAIILTKAEALEMHWRTIRNWKPSSEVWPFTYGIAILTSTSSCTTFSLVNYYRRKVKLKNYGRISMVLPTVTLPTILSVFCHFTFAVEPVLLAEECPLCIQTRAAFIQVMGAVVLPTLVTPLSAFHYATLYSTYDVPPLRKEHYKEVRQLFWKLIVGARQRILIATVINASLASALVYFEAKSFYRCQRAIYEKEDNFRNLVENNSKLS